MDDEDKIAAAAASKVTPLLRPRRKLASFVLPLAASIALIVGFGSGLLVGQSRPGADARFALGTIAPRSALAQTLDTAPSGTPSNTDARLMVVGTFLDKLGRPCREIEFMEAPVSKTPTAAAVACRSGGAWLIEGAARVAAGPAQNGVKPSGLTQKDALAGLLEQLGARANLSGAEERALVDRGWR